MSVTSIWTVRLLAAACALCTTACATTFERQTWRAARTPHFEIASSARLELTREIATKLEFFHAAALGLLGVERYEPTIPTQVYVFGDRPSFVDYQVQSRIAGFFRRGADSNYIVIDASRETEALAISYHEYVHYLLANASSVSYPSWYHEGLAEFLSTLVIDEATQKLQVGLVPEGRHTTLTLGTPLSLARMLGALDTRRWSVRARAMFYAQAWAFTHWAFAGQVLGLPPRRQQLVEYLTLVDRGGPPAEAFQQAFGASMEALEPGFLSYARGKRFGYLNLPLPRFEPPPIDLQPLPTAEKLYLLARLALEMQPLKAPDPERLLRLAVDADPAHAASAAALGALLAAQGDPEGEALIARAAEQAGDDPRIQLAAGQSLQARARREPARAPELRREARQRFARSLELDPNQMQAAVAIALDALTSGEDFDAALSALEAARERRPDYTDLDLLLAQLYLARGQRDAARAALAAAVRQPHAGEVEVPEETERLNKLLDRSGLGAIIDDPDAHLDAAVDWIGPRDEERLDGLVPLAPIKGRAGLGDALLHDVIVVIDESGSTRAPTDFDANGDGIVAAPPSASALGVLVSLATGPRVSEGDTVRAAELAAARRLIERLDPETTRVGVVTFSLDSRVLTPLGTPQSAQSAIEAHSGPVEDGLTNLAGALGTSVQAFVEGLELTTRRQRSVLILSDGAPTTTGGKELAEAQALAAADTLADYGVRVHAFAIGSQGVKESSAYREIARRTSGRYVPVENVADVSAELLDVRLSSLDRVEMRNRTSGEAGRAVRVFPDGSFDGFVPLGPGRNELEIQVQVRGRPLLTLTRWVLYAPPAEPTEEARIVAQRLLEDLRVRTIETELIPLRRRSGSPGSETAAGGTSDEGPGRGTLGRAQGRGAVQVEVAPEEPTPEAPEGSAPTPRSTRPADPQ